MKLEFWKNQFFNLKIELKKIFFEKNCREIKSEKNFRGRKSGKQFLKILIYV